MPNVNYRFSLSRPKSISILIGLALAAGAAFLLVGRSGRGPAAPEVELSEGSSTSPAGSVAEADRYHDPDYGFSFEIPEGLNVSSFAEGEGQMVLVQGQGPQQTFQIFITPFDEPGPITPDRIQQDLPGLAISNLRRATLAGAPAVVFETADPSLGTLSEIWLAHGGQLYQITAPAEFEGQLSAVLATWRFP